MDEIKPAKIRRGPPRREAACYQTTRDIVIPAGTILRDDEDVGIFSAAIGFGVGVDAEFQVTENLSAETCGAFKRVIAA